MAFCIASKPNRTLYEYISPDASRTLWNCEVLLFLYLFLESIFWRMLLPLLLTWRRKKKKTYTRYLVRKPHETAGSYGSFIRYPLRNSGFVSAPEKSVTTARNRGFVRFINTVHHRVTAVESGFVSTPTKRVRSVRNRGLVSYVFFLNTAHRGE